MSQSFSARVGREPARQPEADIADKLFFYGTEASYVVLLSVLWLVCSLPVVTLGPASVALYTVLLNHVVAGRRAYVRGFFTAFRATFRSATIIGLIATVLLAGIGMAIAFYLHHGGWFNRALAGVEAVVFVLIATSASLSFAWLARRQLDGQPANVRRTLSGAWHWAAQAKLRVTLVAGVTIALPAALVWLAAWQFAAFTFGAIAYITVRLLKPVIPVLGPNVP